MSSLPISLSIVGIHKIKDTYLDYFTALETMETVFFKYDNIRSYACFDYLMSAVARFHNGIWIPL